MKISDFIFRYQANRGAIQDSICRVRIYCPTLIGVLAVFTDLGNKNTGNSVTNSIEGLRKELVKSGHIDNDANIIEHYENDSYRGATFDLVTIVDDTASWQPLTLSQLARLADCKEDEWEEASYQNMRIANQIEKTRIQIDPFIDAPYEEAHSVINRRNEIRRNRVPVQQLRSLVDAGSGERALHDLINHDMSLLGEIYASPDEEYIIFSEFPIDDGFVDFAVFTGRSRMDVILIEIKGADFPLVNQSNYRNINSKFNEARQQIVSRLAYVHREYGAFRAAMHLIRKNAEGGALSHRAFISPRTPLQVDPDKDVKVRYVVIGGRTIDDAAESTLRHDFERSFNPAISLETWDSWLRKLRRS